MIKRWLITGGCGFLGTALIKKLLALGFENIRIIDNLQTGTRKDLKKVCNFKEINSKDIKGSANGVELIVGDIKDANLAVRVSLGSDIIVHLAANTGVGPSVENPRDDMLVNVVGTFNYLEAARINKISRFIFASSSAPIGEVEPPIHEKLSAHPVSPYGASKLAGEGFCSAYKRTYEIDTIILRFGNIYGPGSKNKSSVISKFIRQALNGETLEVYGDGNQTRDFIFIDDLTDAILLCSKSPYIGGEIFQIASNSETTISEIANMIGKELNRQGIKSFSLKNVSARIGDVKRNYSDTSKARKKLGWQSKVRLNEGLSKTVSYFLNVPIDK